MSRGSKPSVIGVAILAALLTTAASAQELELRRVLLSAGGVGYFEYEARVDGDATLPLSVRLDQVDDVLKSITVYDDTGAAGAIRLPGREPLSQIYRDLPFGPDALRSPLTLLNSLVGAEVRAAGQREIEGRLVRVVPETITVIDRSSTVTRHRVSVLTSLGLQTFLLEEAESVTFVDPELQAQLESALEAISEHRTRGRRTLSVVSHGEGERTVRVGYVVAAPLWKASYRLTMEDGSAEKARLQGWAVIENMSGQDWEDVELTIASGNPVTFHQALYSAYYVHRPEVPVEVQGRALPRPDAGTLAIDESSPGGAKVGFEEEFRKAQRAELGQGVVEREGQIYVRGGRSSEVSALSDVLAAAPPPAASPPSQARLVAAASQEAATQVTFRIPHAVSVTSGQSVLVPIIDRDVPGERIGLYQPTAHDRHPLAAVRLSNDDETGLPSGVMTLYETGQGGVSHVGDAQFPTLPAGDERLVSFALDQKTLIDREVEGKETIAKGRIVKGVLELTYEAEQTTVYRIKAPAHEDREVLIEHARRQDWKIVVPDPKDVELTDDHYRIRRKVGAGKQANVTVKLTTPRAESVVLAGQSRDVYLAHAENGELSDELREAFREMARLHDVVEGHERRAQELETDRLRIHGEQQRIRDNLRQIPRDSDLYRRYLETLNVQEDAIEKILAEADETRDALNAATEALAVYIRGLEI